MAFEFKLRQRKKSKPAAQKKKKKKDEVKPTERKEEPKEETLKDVFMKHPLGWCIVHVLPLIAIPYLLYAGYRFIRLQYPPPGIMRPAISITDPRQVLIVGTMSSGTVQVANDLSRHLSLEIGHENADTQWSFVRDGTVSWFHGIRYFPPPLNKVRQFTNLCMNYEANMGYHPRMYKPSKCSSHQAWSNCWARECIATLEREWNCGSECETPFQRTLFQVRNPLRTMESLVVKFCKGGLDGKVQPSFINLLEGLFWDGAPIQDLSCIEAAAMYVLKYNAILLQAAEQGLVQMYKVEETSPCHVAHLAGLGELESTLYPPNHEVYLTRCNSGTPTNAQKLMESDVHKINVNMVELSWSDLEGGRHGSMRPAGDLEIQQSVKELFVKLGYNVNAELNVSDPIFDF